MSRIKALEIVERLGKNPRLLDRITALLNIAENTSGDLDRADDAEEGLIVEVREMGKELLQTWAIEQEAKKAQEARASSESVVIHSKKIYWQTTYGQIDLIESRFTKHGKLVRPFSISARIKTRGYSMPLQRRVTDFGADVSFADASEKMKEHYGLDLPPSTVRNTTEKHAKNMRKNQKKFTPSRFTIKILNMSSLSLMVAWFQSLQ